MKYNINEDKIRKQISFLESKSFNKDKKDDLLLLKFLLGENTEAPIFKYNKKQVYQLYLRLLEKIQRFELISSKNIVDVRDLKYNFNRLTEDDILTLVHDFYKTRKKSIFQRFLKCFSKRKTNLQFVEPTNSNLNPAFSFLINSFKEGYIICEYTKTVYDVTKLAHEYGHTTMLLYDKNLYKDKSIVYTELDGIYFELEMMKYLIQNDILNEDVAISELVEHIYMHDAAAYLGYNLNLEDLTYLLSYMISVELRSMDDGDEMLEKIVTSKPKTIGKSLDLIEQNMILNNHLASYHHEIMNNIKKYTLTKK